MEHLICTEAVKKRRKNGDHNFRWTRGMKFCVGVYRYSRDLVTNRESLPSREERDIV